MVEQETKNQITFYAYLFNILSKDIVKGGVWQSPEQLAAQLLEHVNTYNKTSAKKPFE